MIPIEFDVIVFKENETYVAHCPELDVSSCGNSVEHAKEMLKTAIRLYPKVPNPKSCFKHVAIALNMFS